MRKFLILLFFISIAGADYVVQKTWGNGPGIFYTSNWTGFWNGQNIDYFENNKLYLMENSFFMFYPLNLFGNSGTVDKIVSVNPDTVFIGVVSPDSTRIFYTLFYKGFSSNQYFSLEGNLMDMLIYQNYLWMGNENTLFYDTLNHFPLVPVFNNTLNDFRNFALWQDNLYAIQGGGYRYVLRYDGGSWEQVHRFDGNEVNDLVWIFTNSFRGIFVLARKDSVWKIYNSLNGYPPFTRLPSPSDSTGYAIKGLVDSERVFILVKSPPALYSYSFTDSSWQKLFQGDSYTIFEDLIEGKGGALYLLSKRSLPPENILYSSYDRENFYPCDTLDTALEGLSASSLFYVGEGHMFLGTENDPEILYSVFSKKAFITSSAIDLKNQGSYPLYKKFLLFSTGGDVKIKLRTFSDSVAPDTVPWNSLPYLQDTVIENYQGINDGDRYFQYRLEIIPFSQVYPFVLDSLKLSMEYDSVGPVLLSATASDGEWQKNGKDPDDRVIFAFDEPTEKPQVDKFNVDSIFPLSNGHSWLNIYGDFGGALWNNKGDTLQIFLAYSGNQYPTVSPGDTVLARIRDRFGFYRESQTIIQGSFDDVNGPEIRMCVASDGVVKKNGIDDDDFVTIVFSEPTNKPDFDTLDINLVFNLSNGHTFGDSVNAIWITADSLVVNLIPSSSPTIQKGDTIYPSPSYIKDSLGNSAQGWAFVEGTFDEKLPECDSIILYENNFRDTLLDTDDFVVFYFSEPLLMNTSVDSSTIDHAFKLSNNHSWVSGAGKTGEIIFNDDVFIVFFNFERGSPSLEPGDTVYINPVYFYDYGGNSLVDTHVIKYSWIIDPLKEFKNPSSTPLVLNIPFERSLLFQRDARNLEINIYDIAGRCLESIKLKYIKRGKRMILKNLKKGVYFIRIKDEAEKICIYKKVLFK